MDIVTMAIIIIGLDWVKGVTIGSEFNFFYWLRYQAEYTKWYFDNERTEFKPKSQPVKE